MKYAKPNYALLYGLNLLLIITCFFIFRFVTPYIIKAYYFHWVILLGVLILSLLPRSQQKLIAQPQERPRYAFWPWLLQIFALELSLLLISFGIMLVFTYWLPFDANTDNKSVAITTMLHTFFQQFGLFPWACYALYAASIGQISYIYNQDAYMSTMFLPLLKSNPETALGKVLNFEARLATLSALATTFAFCVLLLVCITTPKSFALLAGFHINTLIIALGLILLGFTKSFKKILKPLLQPKRSPLVTIATVLIFFAFLIWVLNALFVGLGKTPVKIPALIQWLNRRGPVTLSLIFISSWWISWTPLFAAHLARLSRGYRIRSVILATLLFPAIVSALLFFFPSSVNLISQHPTITSIGALVAALYLLTKIIRRDVLPILIHSYLPKRDHFKHRDPYFYFRKLFQLMLIIIYLYLPAGITVISVSMFVLVVAFSLHIPLNLITSLFRKRA